ncbi:hypothetical protein ACNF42_02500 [Cuniculiplasma sp. SKW3]|uniref:hypothetical protein n=1 Tax=Cuniculiplasma sp. SKW3 TaxID=3400170 RepID=UPI003FD37615
MQRAEGGISLPLAVDIMKDIMVVYIARVKKMNGRLDFKRETGRNIEIIMKLDQVLKQ